MASDRKLSSASNLGFGLALVLVFTGTAVAVLSIDSVVSAIGLLKSLCYLFFDGTTGRDKRDGHQIKRPMS